MAVLINDTAALIVYTATAGQTVFAVPFEFFDAEDLVVERAGATLIYAASPANASQYSVAGANVEGGGSITLGAPGATLGDRILIYRNIPIDRRANYPETGPMAIRSLNQEQARQIAIMQQLRDRINEAVRVSVGTLPFPIGTIVDGDILGLVGDEIVGIPAVSFTGPQGEQGVPGANGTNGVDGAPGADGADGVGVPAGGTTGQALVKVSDTDLDTTWSTIAGYTDEQVRDVMGTALVAGSGITITPSDGADTITIAASGSVGSATSDLEYFGDGSDGNVTISSGTTTLTRDMFYNNLTISGTGQIATDGFKIFVAGTFDVSAAPANAVIVGAFVGGANGGNGASQIGGSPASVISTNGSVGAGMSGTSGATGGTGAGAQGTASLVTVPYTSQLSGEGGAGGAVGATVGGASRAATALSASNRMRRLSPELQVWQAGVFSRIRGGIGAPGGSAGAGDGVGSGGGGGGGGSGGGVIAIFAKTINRSGSTPTSAINARGGAGGNGSTGSGGTNRGGGGGGAGAAGGWIFLAYRTLTGSTATDALDASGGNGGNGANGTGTGVGGNGGGAGAGGRIEVFDLAAGTQTVTTGGAAVAGGAASGGTGGTGATAAATRVSL